MKDLEAQIMAQLSTEKAKDYEKMCNRWKKNNSANRRVRDMRYAHDRESIYSFLTANANIIQLHNELARAQQAWGSASPLPEFSNLPNATQPGANNTGVQVSNGIQSDIAHTSTAPAAKLPPALSLQTKTHSIVNIENPEDLPIVVIENWNNAVIIEMTETYENGVIQSLGAEMIGSEFNLLIVSRPHLLAAVGAGKVRGRLLPPANSTAKLRLCASQLTHFRGRKTCYLAFARHNYLEWLDLKGTAWPKDAPTPDECRIIAKKVDRDQEEVWKEIITRWNNEHHVVFGDFYRMRRLEHLGELPVFDEDNVK